jgi:hypothetical protein
MLPAFDPLSNLGKIWDQKIESAKLKVFELSVPLQKTTAFTYICGSSPETRGPPACEISRSHFTNLDVNCGRAK